MGEAQTLVPGPDGEGGDGQLEQPTHSLKQFKHWAAGGSANTHLVAETTAHCWKALADEKKGLLQVNSGNPENYVDRLFRNVLPDLADKDIVLDCTHIAGRSANYRGMPQDILTCLHYYCQKEAIMAAVRDHHRVSVAEKGDPI
ncbi:hypothetical protein NDU88_002385 [Pleurodeles waltl]|uniref:Uncharacterized protein n=1 Tax=Pleurodeles waltl TaxID=8319 RepID=A0AAV7KVI9_PLEWA|nr:hypothetical protein NDU88_002385 [Pleurodeles waltl]